MNPMQNYPDPQDGQGTLPAPDPASVPLADTGALPASPAQQPMTPPVPQQSGASYSAESPSIADDVDLIEKEWVIKAKGIVARTKDDPNAQNKDMNRFKADYLKTRYNKDVKVSEA